MLWEVFFLLVVLKIPVVYLCVVVWWAIRAVPDPLEGAALPARLHPDLPGCDWHRRAAARRQGPRPRGGLGRAARARGRVVPT